MSAPGAGDRVELRGPAGEIVYRDSRDHFENALLRLMNLDVGEFESWVALAEEEEGGLLERLGAAWRWLRPLPPPKAVPAGGPVEAGPEGVAGEVWHPSIAESREYGAARSIEAGLAWLVRWDGRAFVRETAPPPYEEEYFEGDKLAAGGYGAYTEQAGWRLEKARRQARELRAATGIEAGRVLDVGCGYGYFRVALGEAGYEHDGLEVSAFARRVASESYGFETFEGALEDRWREWPARYDVITAFDLVEHLPDAVEFLRQAAHCLRPGGVVGVKTPNLDCPEAEVFGPHYHSLKREHLLFLSPRSLTAAAREAGLEPVDVATVSHLLVGFVGEAEVAAWAAAGRGADVVAWYRRP